MSKNTNQRQIDTTNNYLFSLTNGDDDLWNDIENDNKEIIFKVIGHYRKDNTYIDWQNQAKNHPDKDFRQYYQELIDYQDHKDVEKAEKLKIFYDPSDSLDHLDFYNLRRSDCSEDAEASLLPDNWFEMPVADRIKLNPYQCSDTSKMKNNGHCRLDISTQKTKNKSSSVKLKISIEEVVAPDTLSAEYLIRLDSPKTLDISQVDIQYKIISRSDKCNTNASWSTNVAYRERRGIDIFFDQWRDKPQYFRLYEYDVFDMKGSKLCFKASKTADSNHTYIDSYAEINIKAWRVICGYISGTWKICFTID